MPRNICNKLINKEWQPYRDAFKIPPVRGTYVLGEKRSRARATVNRARPRKRTPGNEAVRAITDLLNQYLYLGQSINVYNRIKNHKYGAQKVDAFFRQNLKRNGGKNLFFKWISNPFHKTNEQAYIKCFRERGFALRYNVYRGNNKVHRKRK
ncbi:hypothetical protein ACROYT_G038266 [Oculina patagonica]